MEVQMVDRLPSVSAGVDDRAVAMAKMLFVRDSLDCVQQVAEEIPVFFRARQLRQRSDVFAGQNQQMDRGLGMDVMEGDRHFVFEDFPGGNFAAYDLAK